MKDEDFKKVEKECGKAKGVKEKYQKELKQLRAAKSNADKNAARNRIENEAIKAMEVRIEKWSTKGDVIDNLLKRMDESSQVNI